MEVPRKAVLDWVDDDGFLHEITVWADTDNQLKNLINEVLVNIYPLNPRMVIYRGDSVITIPVCPSGHGGFLTGPAHVALEARGGNLIS